MKMLKFLFGLLPGVTLGMWLKSIWFCFAVCICNPADDCLLWVVFALIINVMAAGWAVACDRERWKQVCNNLNNI
jgi:hypothetical protein